MKNWSYEDFEMDETKRRKIEGLVYEKALWTWYRELVVEKGRKKKK